MALYAHRLSSYATATLEVPLSTSLYEILQYPYYKLAIVCMHTVGCRGKCTCLPMSSVKLVCSSAVNLSTSSSPLRLRGGDGIKLLLHDSSESSSVPKPVVTAHAFSTYM
jgi:hypothetical protein